MSTPFDQFMRDQVALVKKNGARTENIQASVQGEKIRTFNVDIDVEEGDYIERALPTGRIERYLVVDTGYSPSFQTIPASYRMKVRKELDFVEQKSPSAVIYTIQGQNARINISSTDTSINISSVNEAGLFDKMREAVTEKIESDKQQQEILASITAMQAEVGQHTFAHRYKEFVSVIADHMDVLGPFMPALAQLLTG